jgi:hypothetical protein
VPFSFSSRRPPAFSSRRPILALVSPTTRNLDSPTPRSRLDRRSHIVIAIAATDITRRRRRRRRRNINANDNDNIKRNTFRMLRVTTVSGSSMVEGEKGEACGEGVDSMDPWSVVNSELSKGAGALPLTAVPYRFRPY